MCFANDNKTCLGSNPQLYQKTLTEKLQKVTTKDGTAPECRNIKTTILETSDEISRWKPILKRKRCLKLQDDDIEKPVKRQQQEYNNHLQVPAEGNDN